MTKKTNEHLIYLRHILGDIQHNNRRYRNLCMQSKYEKENFIQEIRKYTIVYTGKSKENSEIRESLVQEVADIISQECKLENSTTLSYYD